MRKIYPKQDRAYPEIVKPIHMKLFEIEVVRTYTTTIEIAISPDHLTPSAVERITLGNDLGQSGNLATEERLFYEIWDTLGEAELEQCETETLSVKAKEL